MNNGQKKKKGGIMAYIKARNKKNGLQMTGTMKAKKHVLPVKSAIGKGKIMK